MFLVFTLIALLVVGSVFASYFWWSDWVLLYAPEHMDWQALGAYVGGISGPLLTVILIVLVTYTLRQQSRYLMGLVSENTRLDMLRHLNKLNDEISHVLMRDVPVEGTQRVELGDLVDGLTQVTPLHSTDYKGLVNKLLKLTANYCEALDTYHEEIKNQVAYKIHLQRARELLNFLQKNPKFLNPMAKQVLSYCKQHVRDRSGNGKGAAKHRE